VAEHKILQKSYNDYLGIEEVGKELILYAVGDNALAPLKKLYIGFGDSTVLEMINHLRLKTAIKKTTAQKHKYKTMGYNNPWDPTTSITAYFTQLNRFQVHSVIVALQRARPRKQWRQEHKCGRARCSQRTRWSHGETNPQRNRHGQRSRHTSLRSGWNASSTPQRWQNICDSKRQRFLPKKKQQPRKKENCRPCCSQCCTNNTTTRSRQ
jgi:hypothetical protein